MSDCNKDLKQTDEEIILRDEVSDEAIEAASFARGGLPILAYGRTKRNRLQSFATHRA